MKHALFIAVLFMTFETASGETWYVDGTVSSSGKGISWATAFKTIQEGIDAAKDADRVRVAEGTYTETIDFKDKNITLASTAPLNSDVVNRTIIDGGGVGSVVTFSGKEGPGCVLSGFTIRNGKAAFGGGIEGHGATAKIGNNNITGNSADEGGGLHHCNGTIQNNEIAANLAAENGGGLSDCDGVVQDNVINGNEARGTYPAGNGGGLYDCNGAIQSNAITGNSAEEYGGGLALCDGEVAGNGITGNSAGARGGGLNQCGGIIRENTISNNSAQSGGGLGECHGTIRNNGITGNSAGATGGGLAICDGQIENNAISENSAWLGGGGLYRCGGIIRENTISDNSAESGGGLDDCDGDIRNNVISGNEAHGTYPSGTGGGLYGCQGTIESNKITENSANYSDGGLSHCGALIRNNEITENSAGSNGGGLGNCGGMIVSNLISGNSAGASGGGVDRCVATIQSNVIGTNSAERGGGLAYCNGNVWNNTITRNSASVRGGGLFRCNGTIQNCVVWDNTAVEGGDQLFDSTMPSYSCIESWPGGAGNISSDPRFVDRDGPDNDLETYEDNDYRLSEGSPCIDTGDNTGLNPPGLDFDGNLRIVFGEHSLTVDMGAYEYNSGPLQIQEVLRLGASAVRLMWTSQPNDTYTVWSRSDLPTGTWVEEEDVPSHGEETPWTDPAASGQTKFYRVEMK